MSTKSTPTLAASSSNSVAAPKKSSAPKKASGATKEKKAPVATKEKEKKAPVATKEKKAPVATKDKEKDVSPSVAAPDASSSSVSVLDGDETLHLPTRNETDVAKLCDDMNTYMSRLQQTGSLIVSLKNEFKTLEKQWTRQMKVLLKASKKRKVSSQPRTQSGITKPTRISRELSVFLGKETGSEMARTDVTKALTAYIKENNLQDEHNGRYIRADEKLTALLKLTDADKLSYFNLQKYMVPHFAKKGQSIPADA